MKGFLSCVTCPASQCLVREFAKATSRIDSSLLSQSIHIVLSYWVSCTQVEPVIFFVRLPVSIRGIHCHGFKRHCEGLVQSLCSDMCHNLALRRDTSISY